MKFPSVVLCMKWGSVFSADYVNVLFNACRKNISRPFRFVCLTDDPTGLLKEIETYPIPDIGCEPLMWQQGAWPKLSVFSADLYGIKGKALFIDMDTIIWGSIDRFFDYSDNFVSIDTGINWHPGGVPGARGALVGTGVFAFEIGSQPQIVERFMKDPRSAFNQYRLEQVWVQHHCSSINYWPPGWVISFKRWLRRPLLIDLVMQPKRPDSNTGMVAFHGIPRPISLINRNQMFWDRFPHLGHGVVSWMREYWEMHGGRI